MPNALLDCKFRFEELLVMKSVSKLSSRTYAHACHDYPTSSVTALGAFRRVAGFLGLRFACPKVAYRADCAKSCIDDVPNMAESPPPLPTSSAAGLRAGWRVAGFRGTTFDVFENCLSCGWKKVLCRSWSKRAKELTMGSFELRKVLTVLVQFS